MSLEKGHKDYFSKVTLKHFDKDSIIISWDRDLFIECVIDSETKHFHVTELAEQANILNENDSYVVGYLLARYEDKMDQ